MLKDIEKYHICYSNTIHKVKQIDTDEHVCI